MKLTDYIPHGAANAVTAEKIAEQMGIDTRSVQSLAQIARLQGYPICASCAEPFGLYVAETATELALYCRSLERRIRNTFITYSALKESLDKMTGQERIQDYFEEDIVI